MMNPRELRERLRPYGQEHLLLRWEELRPQQRRRLSEQIAAIDFAQLDRLCRQAEESHDYSRIVERVEPPPAVPLAKSEVQRQRQQRAEALGRQALTAGKVAVVMVAGGQGTRLGFDHAKGMYPIGPVSGKSLFQLHAEKVLATSRRYGVAIPYYVMTSDATHDETVAFFEANGWFGLPREDVGFFRQGWMPAVDARTGKVLLAEKDCIATSPNGHGGTLEALADAGVLDELKRRGLELIFYHQVDNPLVKVCDPAFIGYHLVEGAEVSTKGVAKRSPEDKLGLLVQVDGEARIIEYSELPPEIGNQREADGSLRFWAGNIAVHLFDVAFVRRLAEEGIELPYHRARKKVPYVDETGQHVEPVGSNAFKFERFLFDILPLARRTLVVETDRAEEYDPLKNAEGEHSPESVKRSLSALYAGWLQQAGDSGQGSGQRAAGSGGGSEEVPLVEISPLFALDAEELASKLPAVGKAKGPLYLGPER